MEGEGGPVDGHHLSHDGVRYGYLALPAQSYNGSKHLTPTEQDIVDRILQGASNAEIARARGTRARTVANQLQRIYDKLGVRSRTALCTLIMRSR